jgi:arylsulfatase A-like enzyme
MKKFSSPAIILSTIILATLCSCVNSSNTQASDNPNIIVVFCDDMGYGDLSCFGHPSIKTPQLDIMAAEGQKWTNFYVTAPVCTPSRAGLITGRYPVRSGFMGGVLFPNSKGGLPQSEITIPELLKGAGYSTACIGKWHLGHLPQFLPTSHGFDYYYGIPYSNDMDRVEGTDYHEVCINPEIELFQVPIMRNTEVIERPAQQSTITRRYTEETVKYINENKQNPFFIYLAHNMPHVPLFRSTDFENKSERGIYGDVIEEIDWSVGQIRKALEENGIAENTLVIFTSDNGPWLRFDQFGGSAGLLRDGKGSTFEGGMRVPAIFWWKGKLKPGIVSDMGSTLDFLPTFCNLAGVPLPDDRHLDGFDLSKTLLDGEKSPRDIMIFSRGNEVYAIRKGDFKAHFIVRRNSELNDSLPLLYHLGHDPSEKYNVAGQYPEIIEELRSEAEKFTKTIIPVVDQVRLR